MQLSVLRQVQRKELTLFFTAPIGYLFLAAFLGVTLFVFFWAEAFFARNIADVRPMFEWMPILLIFLCAALTMRMWSEERRSGTLEFVATMPASTWEFVLGKFTACWSLLFIALLLTLPLPITIAVIGDLDWGPVLAGYLAAMLLGAAYLSIGLFVSARTDSQIVSLMLTSLICGLFYTVGSATITELFGATMQGLLSAIGSGSRFEAITRGMIDFRDFYFYTSIALSFLVANVYALERERWAEQGDALRHRNWRLGSSLLVANLLLANVWLQPVTGLRVDVTEGKIYSISDATKNYLARLQEPLLIRGYFSAKTHPDLAPLVPRLKDLLKEYEVAGAGKVRVELLDPADNPELENEANTKYGIRAVPFQVADRRQASLVNSYFDVLISYGDEYEVLGFRDLIEVKATGEAKFDIQLTNPEFDITRSIKKVLYGFQGGSSIFENIVEPVEFVGYISDARVLPDLLVELNGLLDQVLADFSVEGGDKFSARFVDPQAGDGQMALDIAEQFGFQPMSLSLLDDTRFYYYLTLSQGDAVVQIPVPDGLSTESLRRGIEEGLKRFAGGLLKTVVVTAPTPTPPYLQQQGTPPVNEFSQLQSFLAGDFEVVLDDLQQGRVPSQADLLMVLDPSDFTEQQVFAVDQFLMKGGTVVVASGAFAAQPTEAGLVAGRRNSGLSAWLTHHGVEIGASLVMDPQNSAFPVPVTREAGGFSFQDLVMLDYPYFVDVRGEGLSDASPINAGLPQVTVSWVSPLTVTAGTGVSLTPLLSSSVGSWLSSDTDVMPQIDDQGLSGFEPEGDTGAHLLGAALQGKFSSFFAGRDAPLFQSNEGGEDAGEDAGAEESALAEVVAVVERSPESARLLVFGSNDFAADQTLRMVGAADGMLNGNAVQMLTNAADWALEDQSLISIRGRGNFNRTLPGMDSRTQGIIEYLNYALAVFGVIAVLIVFRLRYRRRAERQRIWLQAGLGGQ